MPKVSVIIPAYNAMLYLPETLDTLLGQTFEDFEVIIINDGSTDNIEEWFSTVQVKDSRLRLISQANQGQGKARNIGIQNTRGEYIAFLDADDLWAPTKLEKQVNMLDSNPEAGVVYTWVSTIDSNGASRGRTLKNYNQGKVWRALIQHNFLECGSTPLIRRNCFESVGLFDERLPPLEDLDMWLRISCHYKFLVVKESLVYYRKHPGSSAKNWEAAVRNFNLLLEKAFENPPSEISSSEIDTLKAKAYSVAYLWLAWAPLKSKARDYKTAISFYKIARQYDPMIIFKRDFVRLTVSIWIMQFLKAQNYERLTSLLCLLRRNVFG